MMEMVSVGEGNVIRSEAYFFVNKGFQNGEALCTIQSTI
jgi:hypothetical protein